MYRVSKFNMVLTEGRMDRDKQIDRLKKIRYIEKGQDFKMFKNFNYQFAESLKKIGKAGIAEHVEEMDFTDGKYRLSQ